MTTIKKRDYLFDNYKVLLIFLVVVGHFIDLCAKNNDFLYTLKWFIYAFHMPAFIFVSGYFSKRDTKLRTLVEKLLIPYFVYECLYYLLYVLVLNKQTGLYLMYPKFSLWYILALFFWRLITPYYNRGCQYIRTWLTSAQPEQASGVPSYRRIGIAIALTAGLLIGCSGMKDNFLSIPRILVFYPYFLAGTYFDRETLTRHRANVKYKVGAACTILGFLAFLILEPLHKTGSVKVFHGRYSYETMGFHPIEGILIRILCYAIGFGLTYAIALLMTERKLQISYLGVRTMPIYLFHGLLYSTIKHGTTILQNVNTGLETVLLLSFCVLITFIFALKPFYEFTNIIAGVTLPDFNSLKGKIKIPQHPKFPRVRTLSIRPENIYWSI